MMIYFIGAGPGDPELITVKGAKLIKEADIIVYAGSLVNPEVLREAGPDCEIYNSATMDLDETTEVMVNGIKENKKVVRVHTGDPAIYGAIQEQMYRLDKEGIPYKVIPGVSSFCGASAALKRELTVPDKAQTVILTRMEGRTPVPEREKLAKLAAHQSTMVIFLSVGMLDEVVNELSQHYPSTTPVAVVYKATWPEEKKVIGQLDNIAQLTKDAGITKTALIMVGDFLREDRDEESLLYASHFSSEFRQAKDDKKCD
ncbi:MAG: precorrin-4 C(11)-methyltransferase [Halanaerobiales bacterium]|nr:precorrin-4 C(11)-methyltransferase [Halanaerobiales bacterium]